MAAGVDELLHPNASVPESQQFAMAAQAGQVEAAAEETGVVAPHHLMRHGEVRVDRLRKMAVPSESTSAELWPRQAVLYASDAANLQPLSSGESLCTAQLAGHVPKASQSRACSAVPAGL